MGRFPQSPGFAKTGLPRPTTGAKRGREDWPPGPPGHTLTPRQPGGLRVLVMQLAGFWVTVLQEDTAPKQEAMITGSSGLLVRTAPLLLLLTRTRPRILFWQGGKEVGFAQQVGEATWLRAILRGPAIHGLSPSVLPRVTFLSFAGHALQPAVCAPHELCGPRRNGLPQTPPSADRAQDTP